MNEKKIAVTSGSNASRSRWIDIPDMTRDQLIDYALRLLEERDELLAALRKLADRQWQDETISWRSEAIDMQDTAQAAIAKAE
jgi:hypothetical protein